MAYFARMGSAAASVRLKEKRRTRHYLFGMPPYRGFIDALSLGGDIWLGEFDAVGARGPSYDPSIESTTHRVALLKWRFLNGAGALYVRAIDA